MRRIVINGISLDPTSTSHEQHRSVVLTAPHQQGGVDYLLIQPSHPLGREERARITGLGVTLVERVSGDAYLCHGQAVDVAALRALPFVQWVGPYEDGFKLPPDLRHRGESTAHARITASSPLEPLRDDGPVEVDVVLHADACADAGRTAVARAAGLDPASLVGCGRTFRLAVPPQRLPTIAAVAEVRHIERRVQYELCNNVAARILGATRTHAELGLEGEGQVIAICDTGFDLGDVTNVHPAFSNRVLHLYPLGRPAADDPEGHGTHVAGTALGDGLSSATGVAIRGVAPKARLVLQSVLDVDFGMSGIPTDLHDLFGPPYSEFGARVHSNSWSASVTDGFGVYSQNCRELDDFVWTHRDCVICFAAGNQGRDDDFDGKVDTHNIQAPGTSRNCITVGASENDRPEISLAYQHRFGSNFRMEPLSTDRIADNPEGLAAFSSRGPTTDHRFKPDLVAPGTAILSARSRRLTGAIDHGQGTSDDPLFVFDSGTSMATPLVAGCAAIVREYFMRKGRTPSAALVKAMLINGATPLKGQYSPPEVGSVPDNDQGFGRVDLAATVGPYAQGVTVEPHDEGRALDTGESSTHKITVPDRAVTLKVTLVWTDPPGAILQNDLDLIVKAANAEERHGNMAPSSQHFDKANNVEQVLWSAAPPGVAEITVHARSIAVHPQSFALVIRLA